MPDFEFTQLRVLPSYVFWVLGLSPCLKPGACALSFLGHLPALAIYFQDEERIRGLMFLLTIALTLFTLMEFIVHCQLAAAEQSLSGLYPDGSREITSLNSLQRQILHLMKIPESIYIVPQLVPD